MLRSDDSNRGTYGKPVTCPITQCYCNESCALLMSSEDGFHVCAFAMMPISDTFYPVLMLEEEWREDIG